MEDQQIKPLNQTTEITTEMKKGYLDYAMSVIVARAIPDVRDGLKPSHRRVLYAMHRLGLAHNTAFKKCARIVGEVLGKYHPHGDMAAYDTLVRLGQDFSMRYPLVWGQGNFGSVDGDPPAHMRYTEARLMQIAEEMLSDLDRDTVDFIPNFDATEEEPTVLPSNVPNLLINGTDGIAVGMATKIPPHNLGEAIDALTYMIDTLKIEKIDEPFILPRSFDLPYLPNFAVNVANFDIESEANTEDLMKYVKGPDFPTGAQIYDVKAIAEGYSTGRGGILVRARTEINELKNGRFQILITELPYQQNKATLVAQIADLVKSKKVEEISDIRDESSRLGMRIAIDLKSSAAPQRVLNQLFKYSSLQQNYHFNMLALVDGEPKTLTLKMTLVEYLKHRKTVIIKRSLYDLRKAKEREHILEGLKIALDNLDAVIETIRKSKDADAAKGSLMTKFKLTEVQAVAILDMQLRRLAALERQKILDELKEIQGFIAKLEILLSSPQKLMNLVKEELLRIKEKYGDERRTKIFKNRPGEFSEEELIKEEKVIITLSRSGYIKRLAIDTYRRQGRGGKGVTGASLKEEDVVANLIIASTHDTVYFFTNLGRVFATKIYEIPEASRQARGQAVVNLINLGSNEKVVNVLAIGNKTE